MIGIVATRELFPSWCDGKQSGTKFLRINGGKAYLSPADDRETTYIFTGPIPNTIEEALHMIDEMP